MAIISPKNKCRFYITLVFAFVIILPIYNYIATKNRKIQGRLQAMAFNDELVFCYKEWGQFLENKCD